VASSIAYEPFGPYTGLTYGNAVAESHGFDQDYRLTEITDSGSGSTLQSLAYAYYPTNNVQTITNAVNSGNGQNIGSAPPNYGYRSGSDQLATLSVGGVVTQAIGYTADGRMASLNPGIQAPGGQYITSLSYNQDGRLAAVNAGGGALAGYTYDGFGQRVIKTISSNARNIYQYGQNGMLLEETNAAGAAQADYIYLDGRPVAVLNGSTLYYLHTDHLGTPQLATDSNQVIQWQASYDPFGQASVSGAVTQNLRLPGQYFDVESGWNHNGFRDYAPELGRYIEPDPLGRLGSGNNLYAYAENDPIDWTDPFGLKTCNGTARVMQGNHALVGHGGAFDTSRSNLSKYGVTADSAAIIPSQFGQTKASMRDYLEDVYGAVSGVYYTIQSINGKNVSVPHSYDHDFSDVRDQVDDAGTRADNGLPSTSAYQQWLIKREGGNLIIELPGAPHDGGVGHITIHVPDNWRCPCGTTEVK
jgi:RHS repeat-associated protein